MRISKLKISNFRSIKELEIKLPQICALVGPNNAGKSNILYAIKQVLGRDWLTVNSFSEDDVYSRNPDLDFHIELTVEPPIRYKNFKNEEPVEIRSLAFKFTRYKIGENKGNRRLEQTCHDITGFAPQVLAKAPKKGEPHQFQRLNGIPFEVKEKIPLIYIGTNRSLRDQMPTGRYSLLRQLLEDVNEEFNSSDQTVEVEKPDGSKAYIPRAYRFKELMEAVMELLRTDSFIDLEKSIKRNALLQLGFDPKVDMDKLDMYFAPFETLDFYKMLDLQIKEGDFTIKATDLGEGFQNAIVISILQAFEERRKKGAIILIEEPEMYLHPQMQRSLYKTLREIGKTNQIIYATHSPHFVSIPEYEEIMLTRKEEHGTKIYQSALERNDILIEKIRKELDPERNELFFASRLLLVEGDTEKIAFPEYARRLGIDLDRCGATIVEVGGKRSLPLFADIASSFEIPHGIIYDKDSSDFRKERDKEIEFNKKLDSRQKLDGSVRVWSFNRKYEDHLSSSFGEARYKEVCASFPGFRPAVRARLIAMEPDLPIPEPVEDILQWLANKPE